MKVLRSISEFRVWRRALPAGSLLHFVPTMGALHDGHASLVRAGRALARSAGAGGTVAASIFVNPTQFGPHEDFSKYPRTWEADCVLLEAAGCDAVFAPSAEEMYGPPGGNPSAPAVTVDPGPLGAVLEGAIRPGHFRGVCTVVAKLLGIVQPAYLLLGQKDFQQQLILRHMVADLSMPLEVFTCPTRRESDGLAMSSRNRFLNSDERSCAVALYEALTWAKAAYDGGENDADVLDKGMEQRLVARGLVPQYALIADPATLKPCRETGERLARDTDVVALLAAKLGQTRLIDNMLL